MFRPRFHWQKCTLLCFAWLCLYRDAAAAVLGWQGTAPCSLYSCGDSRYVLSFTFVCGTKQALPWLLGNNFAWTVRALINVFYIILRPVWFQWWQGRRFPNHCIPVNWLSFSWSDFCWWNNPHPGPWQAKLMSGCWCHVSLWMNISCCVGAASSSTSASPVCSASLLCLLALYCPLHLSFLYSFPFPAMRSAVTSNPRLLGWWLLMNTRVHDAETALALGHSLQGRQWVLWGFPLLLKLLWQFVSLHHMANGASLSTVVTVAHLSLNLQNEPLSGSEYPPLSHTKQIWSVFSAGVL